MATALDGYYARNEGATRYIDARADSFPEKQELLETIEKAADFFKGINVSKLFLATAGISLKSGLTYPSLSDIIVKKAMIEAAETTYLVADSSKIGKNAFASLGALSLINYIITDDGIDDKDRKLFEEHEIELIVAS